MANVVVISGKAGHGKDSLANMLKQKYESQGKRVLITHFADYLKFICREYFGWNGVKDEKGRSLLQYVGTDLIRIKHKMPDFWASTTFRLIEALESEFDVFIIPDTRFKNEIEIFKNSRHSAVAIRVIRGGYRSTLTEEQQNHISETALDDYDFDEYVFASSLVGLQGECDNLDIEFKPRPSWIKRFFAGVLMRILETLVR